MCVCSKFGEFLTSHVLQFGYKKNISCQNSVVAPCLFHLWMPVRHLTALAMLNFLKKLRDVFRIVSCMYCVTGMASYTLVSDGLLAYCLVFNGTFSTYIMP